MIPRRVLGSAPANEGWDDGTKIEVHVSDGGKKRLRIHKVGNITFRELEKVTLRLEAIESGFHVRSPDGETARAEGVLSATDEDGISIVLALEDAEILHSLNGKRELPRGVYSIGSLDTPSVGISELEVRVQKTKEPNRETATPVQVTLIKSQMAKDVTQNREIA